jgi:arabinofuranosyltransferase
VHATTPSIALTASPVDARRRLAILWLSLFTLALVRTAWVGDDAYFTFRTIDNFVHGYGVRWNIAERVQAYTHPLWLLVLTPFYWITGEPFFTSIAISAALTLVIVWLLLRRAPSGWTAAAGLTVLLGSRAFIDYSTSGLENPLTHLLLVLFLGRAITERWVTTPTAVLAGLLLLNRLDLAVLVVPVLMPLIPWRGPRRAYRALIVGFLPLLLWEVFSIVYYGFPVPNTAFAKMKTGVAESDLFKQGVTYLLDSVARDPLTLLVACAVGVWAVIENPRRTRAIGIAILLHIATVTSVGGDFMSGRMFAAPLVAAVVILIRADVAALFAYPWMPVALAAVLGVSAFRAIAAGQAIADANDVVAASGVSDERAYYIRSNGLIAYSRDSPYWPRSKWIENGIQTRNEGHRVIVYCCNGMLGYAAGPTIHIVDTVGLGDPLMARLPSRRDWRVGHFGRDVPRGYTETLESGDNHITTPQIAAYYGRLALITRGGLWDRRRWQAILRMNLGRYDSLLAEAAAGAPACAYTLLRTTQQMAADGGRGSFTAAVNSQAPGCGWKASSPESWIRLADVAGAGTGAINFAVDANRTTTERVGTVTVAWPEGSATFTLKQDGLTNCRFALTPTSQIAESTTRDFSMTVSPSDQSCGWKADADVPWIAITGGNTNTGVGTVLYRVQANDTRQQRAGAITITGLISGRGAVAVTQRP